MTTFAPLAERPSAVDLCASALREAILDGSMAPGTQLPAERRLAEQFGVNRVTVRGALARLAASGLLTVRQGSGYRVRDYLRHGGPDLLPDLAAIATAEGRLAELASDLLLIRRQLAAAVLTRLAERCDAAGREGIASAVADFTAVAQRGDGDAIAEADLAVLSAILDATRSPVLGVCFNPIAAALRDLVALRRAIYADPASNVLGWQLLVAWLQQPDPQTVSGIVDELAKRDEQTVARIRGAESAASEPR